MTEIAENIQIIELQDSLLMIAGLSDKDKKKLAKKLQEDKEKEDALAAANKKNKIDKRGGNPVQSVTLGATPNNGRGGLRGGGRNNNTGGSAFFAYDDRLVKKGKKDFERKWGKSQLSDNWRRSNRSDIADISNETASTDIEEPELGDAETERIFKDVPKTEEEIKLAGDKIADAMMVLGRLYRERLERDDKTVDILEAGLLIRFPKTKHQLDAWYYLYLSHTDLGNATKAKEYFDKIVKKYPTSTYARILKDPNFLADSKKKEKELDDYYRATFVSFQDGQYQKAFDRSEKVTDLFGKKNNLQAKFSLLKAMCIGNLKGKEAYIESLKSVIAKFPDTQEQTRAKEVLRLLEGRSLASLPGNKIDDVEAANKFKVEHDKLHYILIVITDKGKRKVNEAKTQLADFHRSNYKLEKMRIANIYLGTNTDQPIIVVRKFKNKNKAMMYHDAALDSGGGFMPEGMSFDLYPITQANYRQILRDKTLDGYAHFFKENYLEEEEK